MADGNWVDLLAPGATFPTWICVAGQFGALAWTERTQSEISSFFTQNHSISALAIVLKQSSQKRPSAYVSVPTRRHAILGTLRRGLVLSIGWAGRQLEKNLNSDFSNQASWA
jgi:hypothetical protein